MPGVHALNLEGVDLAMVSIAVVEKVEDDDRPEVRIFVDIGLLSSA